MEDEGIQELGTPRGLAKKSALVASDPCVSSMAAWVGIEDEQGKTSGVGVSSRCMQSFSSGEVPARGEVEKTERGKLTEVCPRLLLVGGDIGLKSRFWF